MVSSTSGDEMQVFIPNIGKLISLLLVSKKKKKYHYIVCDFYNHKLFCETIRSNFQCYLYGSNHRALEILVLLYWQGYQSFETWDMGRKECVATCEPLSWNLKRFKCIPSYPYRYFCDQGGLISSLYWCMQVLQIVKFPLDLVILVGSTSKIA